jgi:hypothetical protein
MAMTRERRWEVVPLTLPPPADAEALFKEAKRRERRRRITVVVVVLAVAIVAVVPIAYLVGGAPASKKTGTHSPISPAVAGIPSFYVVHAPTATGSPGAINVVDTSTGQVIRALGSAYDPYLENGFQLSPDRFTLYYTRLNQAAQTIEIVAVPVAGGPGQVVAHGITPLLSPDGTKMSFEPYGQPGTIAIMDLATRKISAAHIPTTSQSQVVFGTSWLPGSRQLLVTIGTPISECSVAPGFACQTLPPPTPPVAKLLNATGPAMWLQLPPPKTIDGGWTNLSLQGPGPEAGTVLATNNASTSGSSIDTVQVATGRVLSSMQIPTGTSLLARDQSGTHFLLSGSNGTALWSPPRGATKIVGPTAAEAAW